MEIQTGLATADQLAEIQRLYDKPEDAFIPFHFFEKMELPNYGADMGWNGIYKIHPFTMAHYPDMFCFGIIGRHILEDLPAGEGLVNNV